MSSVAQDKAATYVGAVATTWAAGGPATPQVLYRASASATSTSVALPTYNPGDDRLVTLQGRFVDIYSSDVAVQYAFGVSSAPTLVFNQTAAIGTGHVAAGATLPPGVVHCRLVPKGATHLALIANAGPTGIWEVVLTDAPAI